MYLERTVAFFQEKAGLRMKNPHRFGGTGNVTVPRTARQGRLLLAGEAAGFQDGLWGFGMRYAIVSGHLAVRALLDGGAAARLGSLLRAGVVNRYLYARVGDRGYAALVQRVARARDARVWLHRQYRLSLFRRMLYPLANRAFRSRRADAACVMDGCDCTWCRCQHRTPLDE